MNKEQLLKWLYTHCLGYRNARHRGEILRFVGLSDREFRRMFNELGPEENCFSCSKFGYWVLPLTTNDSREIEAARGALLERRAKALTEIHNIDKNLDKLNVKIQGQQAFVI